MSAIFEIYQNSFVQNRCMDNGNALIDLVTRGIGPLPAETLQND